MANKKISQLEETQDVEDLYIIGSKETGGNIESKKFNMQTFKSNIQNTLDSIQGQTSIPEFSVSENYYKGSYVFYNNEVYKFTNTHYSGPWTGNDVIQTSVFGEINSIESGGGDYETVTFIITSSDGSLDVSGRTINITVSDGTTRPGTTDSEGKYTTTIEKGLTYSASVTTLIGYTVGNYTDIKATLNERTVNFIYYKDLTDKTTTINVEVLLLNGGVLSDFSGKTVELFDESGQNTWTSSGLVISGDRLRCQITGPTENPIYQGKSYSLSAFGSFTGTSGAYYLQPSPLNITIVPQDTTYLATIAYRRRLECDGIFLVKESTGTFQYTEGGDNKNFSINCPDEIIKKDYIQVSKNENSITDYNINVGGDLRLALTSSVILSNTESVKAEYKLFDPTTELVTTGESIFTNGTCNINYNGKSIYNLVCKKYNTETPDTVITLTRGTDYTYTSNEQLQITLDNDLETDDSLIIVYNSEVEINAPIVDTLTTNDKNNYPALHVCTSVLANSGCDYYVRCIDLTKSRTYVVTKQWSTSGVTYPNVKNYAAATPYYDGKRMTYMMAYDGRIGISSAPTSPAAEYANSKFLTISGKSMRGFIGTRDQMESIFTATTNYQAITTALGKLYGGSSNINYRSTNIWSSSQNNATSSWHWNSGSWNSTYLKTGTNYYVLPFFAV